MSTIIARGVMGEWGMGGVKRGPKPASLKDPFITPPPMFCTQRSQRQLAGGLAGVAQVSPTGTRCLFLRATMGILGGKGGGRVSMGPRSELTPGRANCPPERVARCTKTLESTTQRLLEPGRG